jgi:hypothetical protein
MVTFLVDGQEIDKLMLSKNAQIYQLKRLVLYLIGNKPFFFDKCLNNESELYELLTPEGCINIYLDIERFNLNIWKRRKP